jgi:hypothetical protein
MGEMRNAYNILVGKPERRRPLGSPRSRWEGEDWMLLAQDREQWQAVVNTVMKLGVPLKAGNFMTS